MKKRTVIKIVKFLGFLCGKLKFFSIGFALSSMIRNHWNLATAFNILTIYLLAMETLMLALSKTLSKIK